MQMVERSVVCLIAFLLAGCSDRLGNAAVISSEHTCILGAAYLAGEPADYAVWDYLRRQIMSFPELDSAEISAASFYGPEEGRLAFRFKTTCEHGLRYLTTRFGEMRQRNIENEGIALAVRRMSFDWQEISADQFSTGEF